MIRTLHLCAWLTGRIKSAASEDRAAQLVEFAISLPLLVVFVVGIFDFSNAFTLKQKLTNAARDAARTAAAEPTGDLQSTLPMSVVDAFQSIDNYLLANHLSDCGAALVGPFGPPLTWKYQGTGPGCPPGGLTIIINRGYFFPASGTSPLTQDCTTPTDPGSLTALVSTCVSIQYAYSWKFGRVASLIGATSNLTKPITATAVAMNEN
jgi:hypothetical protein